MSLTFMFLFWFYLRCLYPYTFDLFFFFPYELGSSWKLNFSSFTYVVCILISLIFFFPYELGFSWKLNLMVEVKLRFVFTSASYWGMAGKYCHIGASVSPIFSP